MIGFKALNNALSSLSKTSILPQSILPFHTSCARFESDRFVKYNQLVYPPLQPGEEERPAFVCHQKLNIKYQPKKMYYIARFVRGMSVEEALRQLSQVPRKGALVVADTIREAQDLAVAEHNVEFRSNLWVAESFSSKGLCVKGIRRHAKMRVGEIRYLYCHYFVRLEEGPPPKQYYWTPPMDGPSQLERFVQNLRARRIIGGL